MKNMPKEFDLKHWRAVYNRVQSLGAYLKQCRDDKVEMKEGEKEHIEGEIKTMVDNLNIYMDRSGVKMPPPLWIYDNKDPKTHRSSDEFIYHDRCA